VAIRRAIQLNQTVTTGLLVIWGQGNRRLSDYCEFEVALIHSPRRVSFFSYFNFGRNIPGIISFTVPRLGV